VTGGPALSKARNSPIRAFRIGTYITTAISPSSGAPSDANVTRDRSDDKQSGQITTIPERQRQWDDDGQPDLPGSGQAPPAAPKRLRAHLHHGPQSHQVIALARSHVEARRSGRSGSLTRSVMPDERKLQIRIFIRSFVYIYRGGGGQFGPSTRIEYTLIANLGGHQIAYVDLAAPRAQMTPLRTFSALGNERSRAPEFRKGEGPLPSPRMHLFPYSGFCNVCD
jgi:hypothetical protein